MVSEIVSTHLAGYSGFIEQVESSEIEAVETEVASPTQVAVSVTRMEFKPRSLVEQRGLPEELVSQTDIDPQASRARRVRAVLRHPAWSTFQSGYEKLANLWGRKLVGRSATLISGALGLAGGYLAYNFMVQKAAAAALAASAPAGTAAAAATAPNMRNLRYAGAAGLLANSVTIFVSLPQMVISVTSIVSSIKQGVQLKQTIRQNEQALESVRGKYQVAGSDELAAEELKLVETITADRATLAGLPASGIINASVGMLSAISVVHSALGIATTALQAAHGSMATLGALAQVSSVLGPLAGAIGVGLGGLAVAVNGHQALKTYREATAVRAQMDALDGKLANPQLSPAMRALVELELKVLVNKNLKLKDDLRHTLITLSSNLVLTFAGVAGLLAAVGVVTGPGALVMGGVALALTGVSAGISVSHYFYRKHTQQVLAEQMRPQQMSDAQIDGAVEDFSDAVEELSDAEVLLFLPAWSRPEQREEMIQKFRAHPEVYLKEHFSVLALPEDKAA
jgi:hypothetical protein